MASLRLGRLVVGLALGSACAHQGPATERGNANDACVPRPMSVEVLGSGGPVLDDGRAQSGYLIRQAGHPPLLVDAGEGVGLRLAETGVSAGSLCAVIVSHLHTDHSAGLAALFKDRFFTAERALHVVGPSGAGPFPSITAFVDGLVGPRGLYAYLSPTMSGEHGVSVTEVADAPWHASLCGLEVSCVHVPHGPVPALGCRLQREGHAVVFASDQTLDDPAFAELAQDADVLVVHHPVSDTAKGVAATLHAKPEAIAAFVRQVKPRRVVLSHIMARGAAQAPHTVDELQSVTDAQVAQDHACVAVP